jgi:hypothetical protein
MRSSLKWSLNLLTALVSLTMFGQPTPARAVEGGVPAERLERLEQHVKEMAERQEQFMRRVGSQMEQAGGQMKRQGAGLENMRQPMPPPQDFRPPTLPAGAPPAARHLKSISDALGFLFLIGVVCNILMAIWIFTDIRKRGDGSAIFVAMALVAGIPAALIYALTRIGDKKPSAP